MAFSALWFGLKPLLRLKNFASQIGSNTCRIHCWMSLSIIVGIPRGRVFPLSFGISTLRTALGIYQSSLRWTWATKAFSVPFIQIAYCLVIHTRRPTAAVLSDIPICQLDVFRAFYQFHKIAEPLPLDTCGIQFVKNKLHIVVFRVADFLFL